MKRGLVALLIGLLSQTVQAQEAQVEKSIFGIQTGYFGIWANNESRLSKLIALRSEVGLDASLAGGSFYGGTVFSMYPTISVEPRWYYNLNKRARKSKTTANNSGNFLSVKNSFRPDWFVLSTDGASDTFADVLVEPTWGIRRNIGKHFNYELGTGIYFRYVLWKREGFPSNDLEAGPNLNLRVGYTF